MHCRTKALVLTAALVASGLGSATAAQADTREAKSQANKAIARKMVAHRGWSAQQYRCLVQLWTRESGWNHRAGNSGGAYGIPQALPGHKMSSAGNDWRTNPRTQIEWGLGYIKQRYAAPCRAWAHFQSHGWY